MKTSNLTIDSTTGFYDPDAPIYDWDGYIFNSDGDEVPEDLTLPFEFII